MGLDTAIEAKHLTKRYEDFIAVNGIDIEVSKGECFGLLGPNGAGKTSLMKMMYCHAMITEGELFVLGLNAKKNFREIKSKIGVVPQENLLDSDFNLIDNLKLFSKYHQIDPEAALEKNTLSFEVIEIEEFANHQIENLSGGTQRRLAIARALLNSPELIFLDEPTTGLDPQSRLWLWNFIKQIKETKGTIFLTTHYIDEAEELCDRVAIMDHGKILCIDQPRNLIKQHIGHEIVEFYAKPTDLNYYLNRLKEHQFEYQVYQNMVLVFLKLGQESKVIFDIIKSERVTIRKPTLNDVFLKFAGYNLRDE